mgnify:CR=1 FL=1
MREKVFLYFIVIFSITMPFQFNLFKINTFFHHYIQLLYKSIAERYFFNVDLDWLLVSDSILLYAHLVIVLIIACFLSLIRFPKKISSKVSFALIKYCSYYLSLMLLIYGCNKLFKYQFFDPHPNTVFMPVGQLTKDFLYWTAIGTSKLYNSVLGIVEILLAISLWYKPTKVFGSFLAWLVLAHIVLINFAFDINVKVQSIFLLFVCTVILLPYLKSMFNFFVGKQSQLKVNVYIKSGKLKLVKAIVIIFIVLESFYPYLKSNTWNGDNATKPPHFGAYEILNNNNFKRFFIHSDPYFIVQTVEDEFYSFRMTLSKDKLRLNQNEQESVLSYTKTAEYFLIEGNLFGQTILWKSEAIPFQNSPIYQDDFNWFIEQIKD